MKADNQAVRQASIGIANLAIRAVDAPVQSDGASDDRSQYPETRPRSGSQHSQQSHRSDHSESRSHRSGGSHAGSPPQQGGGPHPGSRQGYQAGHPDGSGRGPQHGSHHGSHHGSPAVSHHSGSDRGSPPQAGSARRSQHSGSDHGSPAKDQAASASTTGRARSGSGSSNPDKTVKESPFGPSVGYDPAKEPLTETEKDIVFRKQLPIRLDLPPEAFIRVSGSWKLYVADLRCHETDKMATCRTSARLRLRCGPDSTSQAGRPRSGSTSSASRISAPRRCGSMMYVWPLSQSRIGRPLC